MNLFPRQLHRLLPAWGAMTAALLCSGGLFAQTVITSTPTSLQAQTVAGADSTDANTVATPDVSPSTVNLPWNYVVSCTPSSAVQNTTGTCPSGETYDGIGYGQSSFAQTYTVTTSCPNGQYASGTQTTSTPTPLASAVCAIPKVTCSASSSTTTASQSASCPTGYTTAAGSSTFTQTDSTTTETTCASPYSTPVSSVSTTAWSPTAASECTTSTSSSSTGSNLCYDDGGSTVTVNVTTWTLGTAAAKDSPLIAGGLTTETLDHETTVRTPNYPVINGAVQSTVAGTITYNGATSSFSLTCSGQGSATTDECDTSQSISVGGATFKVGMNASTSVRGDDEPAMGYYWYEQTGCN